MADPVVVLILVGSRAVAAPDATAVGAAVRDGVGTDAQVLVEQVERDPTDDEATRVGERFTASAVAELRWLEASRTRAIIRMYTTQDRRWHDREVTFASADALGERERTLGLLVGAMLKAAALERTTADEGAASTETATPVTPPARPPPASTQEEPRPLAPPAKPPAPRVGVELGALGAVAPQGAPLEIGPALGVLVFPAASLTLRAAGAVTFGRLQPLEAELTTLRLGSGASVRALRFGKDGRGSLQCALDVAALNYDVHRRSPDTHRSRWLGAASTLLVAGWYARDYLEPFLGVGVEYAFGNTPLVLDGRRVAALAPVRVLAVFGVRVAF